MPPPRIRCFAPRWPGIEPEPSAPCPRRAMKGEAVRWLRLPPRPTTRRFRLRAFPKDRLVLELRVSRTRRLMHADVLRTEGEATYAAGIVKTKWFAVRNKKDVGSFFVEERNVARDFERAFGFVPEEVNIGVTCNSQYTGTSAAAELDWIELVPAREEPTKKAEER